MSDAADLVRRFLQVVWNERRIDRMEEFVGPRVVLHPARGPPRDLDGYRQMATAFQAGFSDLRFDVERVGADGHLVFVRLWIEGTQDGPWHGRPPTGRRMRVLGQPQVRVEDGKIVEFFQLFDELGALQQLGHA